MGIVLGMNIHGFPGFPLNQSMDSTRSLRSCNAVLFHHETVQLFAASLVGLQRDGCGSCHRNTLVLPTENETNGLYLTWSTYQGVQVTISTHAPQTLTYLGAPKKEQGCPERARHVQQFAEDENLWFSASCSFSRLASPRPAGEV